MSLIEGFPKNNNNNNKETVGFTPIGTIISVMGNSAPKNYLACNGQELNITDYPELANYFKIQFGSINKFGGNGTTTFCVPDLRGEFLRGTGANSHTNQGSGAAVGTHQNGTKFKTEAYSVTDKKIFLKGYTQNYEYTPTEVDYAVQGTTTSSQFVVSSAGTYSENTYISSTARPTNTSVLWCIAYKNIYINDVYENIVCGYTPVGTIISVSGNCPRHYHDCDGSVLNIEDYPQLAEYYKTSFGSYNYYGGDGITTFAVPDLRGEFIRGTGTNGHAGQGSGANVGVHQDATKHVSVESNSNSIYAGEYNLVNAEGALVDYKINSGKNRWIGSSYNSITDERGYVYTSRPTNTSLRFCVALYDIYITSVAEIDESILETKADLVNGKVPASQLPTTGHIISDNGTELSEQSVLNFIDFDIEDDTENEKTDVKAHRLTQEELDEIFDEQPNILGVTPNIGFTPVGTIISVMGKTAPSNYLACDGTEVLIMEYPDLAKYFEEQFGSKNHFGGDGTTTFAVPDLRGEFLRGTGTNLHTNQGNGANVGEHQDASLPNIKGTIKSALHINSSNSWLSPDGALIKLNSASVTHSQVSYSGNLTRADGVILDASGYNSVYQDGAEAKPTNTSVLYCIAVKNIYIDPKYEYTTYEKIVGTWIDGKPLYQKTYTCTSPSNSTDAALFSIDSNIRVKNIFGMLYSENSTTSVPINYEGSTSYNSKVYVQSDNKVRQIVNGYYNYSEIITLQYTKTTD